MKAIIHIIQALLLLCAFLYQDTTARPFTKGRKSRSTPPIFPTDVPTTIPVIPCFESFPNGTQSNKCCPGYIGDACDVLDGKIEFDPVDPCKNLICAGVENAQCFTISKCGDRWPVFLLQDGTLAECSNGQPVNVIQLTCSEKCTSDPCAGKTCSMFPDAFCVYTACDCNEPMWLVGAGVQVDCETGEHLSPEEAKSRRRRKRQTTTQASTCS